MTAQNLRRTYAELGNCERLTKYHKLNLRKIYAKLTQNLGKAYEKLTKFIRFFVNRAPVPEMLSLPALVVGETLVLLDQVPQQVSSVSFDTDASSLVPIVVL